MSRKIDALVAEKVMGWRVHHRNTAWWVKAEEENSAVSRPIAFVGTWAPSEDIADAWEVVEKMRGSVHDISVGWHDNKYTAVITVVIDTKCGFDQFQASADTAPMAICLAALKAKGVDIEEGE
jgi:hypothetical protein